MQESPCSIDHPSYAVETLKFAGTAWQVQRPKDFVLVFDGAVADVPADYLHAVLLAPSWREQFLQLVDATGLVVCLNLPTQHPTYRDVRGRSSKGRLSQGEYYHHDGCSSPQKPRVVEIRCPYQAVARSVATAVAPHRAVVRAMLQAMPPELASDAVFALWQQHLRDDPQLLSLNVLELDRLQGLMNRTLRRKLPAEATRAYFREVDDAADAYRAPWVMGESRLISNAHAGRTMQHRRAYLEVNRAGVANGSLVKRWPHEELALPGQPVDEALIASFCSDEDGACGRSETDRGQRYRGRATSAN